jgi:hypothetical protein
VHNDRTPLVERSATSAATYDQFARSGLALRVAAVSGRERPEGPEMITTEAAMEPVVFSRDSGLDALRRRRAELRESIGALEQALAAPASGRAGAWAERVHVALVELSADLTEHITVTEGPDGLHRDIVATAPRLSNAVERLTGEHTAISGLVADLLTRMSDQPTGDDVDAIRDLSTALLGHLARHRQRGADLVYEAYQADIGGET